MLKDTGELIFKKSINLYCQPIFSYISSFVIAPYAPFSQSLSHIPFDISFFFPDYNILRLLNVTVVLLSSKFNIFIGVKKFSYQATKYLAKVICN